MLNQPMIDKLIAAIGSNRIHGILVETVEGDVSDLKREIVVAPADVHERSHGELRLSMDARRHLLGP